MLTTVRHLRIQTASSLLSSSLRVHGHCLSDIWVPKSTKLYTPTVFAQLCLLACRLHEVATGVAPATVFGVTQVLFTQAVVSLTTGQN